MTKKIFKGATMFRLCLSTGKKIFQEDSMPSPRCYTPEYITAFTILMLKLKTQ